MNDISGLSNSMYVVEYISNIKYEAIFWRHMAMPGCIELIYTSPSNLQLIWPATKRYLSSAAVRGTAFSRPVPPLAWPRHALCPQFEGPLTWCHSVQMKRSVRLLKTQRCQLYWDLYQSTDYPFSIMPENWRDTSVIPAFVYGNFIMYGEKLYRHYDYQIRASSSRYV